MNDYVLYVLGYICVLFSFLAIQSNNVKQSLIYLLLVIVSSAIFLIINQYIILGLLQMIVQGGAFIIFLFMSIKSFKIKNEEKRINFVNLFYIIFQIILVIFFIKTNKLNTIIIKENIINIVFDNYLIIFIILFLFLSVRLVYLTYNYVQDEENL